jgi:hypothetical protein
VRCLGGEGSDSSPFVGTGVSGVDISHCSVYWGLRGGYEELTLLFAICRHHCHIHNSVSNCDCTYLILSGCLRQRCGVLPVLQFDCNFESQNLGVTLTATSGKGIQ